MKVITFVSGKGGVGCTTLAANLAWLNSNEGEKTLLLDADPGCSDTDIVLGQPLHNRVSHTNGDAGFSDLSNSINENLDVVAFETGYCLAGQPNAQHLIKICNTAPHTRILIDASGGLHSFVSAAVSQSQLVILVVNATPSSIADAFAVVGLLKSSYTGQWACVVNNAISAKTAKSCFAKLAKAIVGSFNIKLIDAGFVLQDSKLEQCAQKRVLSVESTPKASSTKGINSVWETIKLIEATPSVNEWQLSELKQATPSAESMEQPKKDSLEVQITEESSFAVESELDQAA